MSPPIECLSILVAAVVATLAVAGVDPRIALVESPGRTIIVIGASLDEAAAAADTLVAFRDRAAWPPAAPDDRGLRS